MSWGWKPRTDLNWDTSSACGPIQISPNGYQFRNTFMIPSFTFLYKFPILTVGGPVIPLFFTHLHYHAFIAKIKKKVHRKTAEFHRKVCFQLMSSEISLMQYWWTQQQDISSSDYLKGVNYVILTALSGKETQTVIERESKKRCSLAVRGEWQDIWH